MNSPDAAPYMQTEWRLVTEGRRNGLPNGSQKWPDKQQLRTTNNPQWRKTEVNVEVASQGDRVKCNEDNDDNT
jgi:hypothetical protein